MYRQFNQPVQPIYTYYTKFIYTYKSLTEE